ncbi:MAG: hypothetical protein ACRDVC_06465 [Acidimicrobiales bacterium]
MTDTDLERAYRRWLRWYPKSFRAEYEAEILGLLLDGARDGQSRPAPTECLDLVLSAVCAHLRPRVAQSERSVYAAIRAMWLGTVIEFVTVITLVVTMGAVRANARSQDPGFTAHQWHATVAARIEPNVIGGLVAIGFWLCLAWSFGRGHRWPKVALPVFFALNLLGLLNGVLHDAASTAQPDLVAAFVLCLVELVAVILMFRAKAATSTSDTARPSLVS